MKGEVYRQFIRGSWFVTRQEVVGGVLASFVCWPFFLLITLMTVERRVGGSSGASHFRTVTSTTARGNQRGCVIVSEEEEVFGRGWGNL